jgi:hypothetical protein
VHDALDVDRGERAGELQGDLERLRVRQADALAAGAQRLAFEELHRDVGRAAGQLADVEDLHDAGVIDDADGARLVEEAPRHLAIRDVLGAQHLDGDAPDLDAARGHLVGRVDMAHPAFAEEADDLIGADPLSEHPCFLD